MSNIENIQEIWKPIFGFENRYEISSLGKIFSKKKGRNLGLRKRKSTNYINTTLIKEDEYGNKTRVAIMIHRLLAQHFIPNPENKPFVNHIDGNKLNNSLNNLEWVTASENTKHAWKIGLMKSIGKGSKHHNSKLNESAVKIIKYFYKIREFSAEELSIAFNVNIQLIYQIWDGKAWQHVKP